MKKLYSFCLLFLALFAGLLLSSCAGRYDTLSMSATISYSKDSGSTQLDDGTYRVSGVNGTFDAHPDGSYTLYISGDRQCQATVTVSFYGAPAGFSYGLIFEQTNDILNILSESQQAEEVKVLISAGSVGQTKLTIGSAEGGKSDSIFINVVEATSDFDFVQDSIALINERGEAVDLLNQVVKTSSTDISFSFGYMSGDDFVEYSTSSLRNDYGIEYNTRLGTLSITSDSTSLETLMVRATSLSPLGDEQIKYISLYFVHALTDFEIYRGTSYRDVVESNLISSDDVCDFVFNYNSLNAVDFVLIVRNNAQRVSFDMARNVYLEKTYVSPVTYIDAGGEEVDSVLNSRYALVNMRLLSNSKTSNLADKTFEQVFTCDYADYVVEDYPLSLSASCRIYDLVQNYSINGTRAENVKISNDFSDADVSKVEVYINGSSSYKGAMVNIGLSRPSVVDSQHSSFSLSLYRGDKSLVSSPESYFSIYLASGSKVNFSDTFSIDTTLFIKPSETSFASNNENYYLVITALEPSEDTLKVGAVVKIGVLNGITAFTSVDYTIEKYELDEINGGYVVDDDGNYKKIIENHDNVTFDDFTLTESINLDLSVEGESKVTVRFTPANASLLALRYEVRDELVANIRVDDVYPNIFYIRGISSGSTVVNILTDDLSYAIPVNVFMPITDFFVLLSDPTSSNIATCETDISGNVESIMAKTASDVSFRVLVSPLEVTQYTLTYTLDRYDSALADFVSIEDGSQSVTYDELMTSRHLDKKIKDGESFIFRLADNSFSFINLTSDTSKYRLTIKVQNLSGLFIEREVIISGYNPSDISLSLSRKKIYNSQSISILRRIDIDNMDGIDIGAISQDSTCFGVKVTDVTSLGSPTYPFADNGRISFKYNGMVEGLFRLEGGLLVEESSHLIKAVTPYAIAGYYYFKLESDLSRSFDLLLEATLRCQFSDRHFSTITKNATISVTNAKRVSSIITGDELDITYNVDRIDSRHIDLSVKKDDAYDKTLLALPYRVYHIGNSSFFVYDESFVNIDFTSTMEGRYSLDITATSIGEGRIIVLPIDSILTSESLASLYGESTSITLASIDDFVYGLMYEDSALSTLAQEAVVGRTYYISAINQANFARLFDVFCEVYVKVNDGSEGNEYEISSLEDLLSITSSAELASRNYRLVRDIYVDSSTNFSPLATYYNLGFISEYPLEDVFVYNDGEYVKVDKEDEPFNPHLTYYGYGFNGKLSGKMMRESITGQVSERVYSIRGLFFNGACDYQHFGLFSSLGSKAQISDLTISYSVFTPSMVSNMTFGALTALNYGTIKDVSIDFGYNHTSSIKTDTTFIFGGLCGINYGYIDESEAYTLVSCSLSLEILQDVDCFVGGICGKNYGEILGNFNTANFVQKPTLNTAEITVVAELSLTSCGNMTRSYIGGAVGQNVGSMGYVVVSGEVSAPSFVNVGGLVGSAEYSEKYNNEANDVYSIFSSYSTAIVSGRENVGGAIGQAIGRDETRRTRLYYVGAENVVGSMRGDRPLVSADSTAGGFVSSARFISAKYCYAATYFEGMSGFDVISLGGSAGAFAYSINDCSLIACASKMNVSALSTASIFIVNWDSDSALESIMAYGVVVGSVAIDNLSNIQGIAHYICIHVYENAGVIERDTSYSNNIGESTYIKQNDNGSYYISIVLSAHEEPLFVTDDIVLSVNIRDNDGEYIDYLKGGQRESLVLFYNQDSERRYSSQELDNLNTIDLFGENGIVIFDVNPWTVKTARVNMVSYNPSILRINSDGSITLLGEGKTSINISSQLNEAFFVDIQVTIMLGVNYVGLFDSLSFIREISDTSDSVSMLIGDQSLFTDAHYERSVAYEGDYSLDVKSEIGMRFKVYDDEALASAIGARYSSINDILSFSSNAWIYVLQEESEEGRAYFYIDIDDAASITLNARGAIDNAISIHYEPYIVVEYQSSNSKDKIFLNNFKKDFSLIITRGATDIRLADNSSGEYAIYQHESLIFTIVVDTDYDGDYIEDNSYLFTDKDSLYYDANFTLVGSDLIKNYDQNGQILSIMRSYTFSFKDKLGQLDTTSRYYHDDSYVYCFVTEQGEQIPLRFWASSQTLRQLDVRLTVNSKSTLDEIKATIYSDIMHDFPQKDSKENIVYSGNTALVVLDVYPFFTTYSKIRLSYTSGGDYSIIISQVEYSSDSTERFRGMPTAGTIVSGRDSILIDKSTGQDLFDSSDGKYSYGRNYFFSITIPMSVPNRSEFALHVEVLSRNNSVISSLSVPFTALHQPRIDMQMDSSLKDASGTYYLPLYTDNVLSLETINGTGDISFVVEIDGMSSQPSYDTLTNALTPVYEGGEYHVKVFSYESGVDLTSLIGKKVTISATMGTDYVLSNTAKVEFIITLFTVKSILIEGAQDGIISLATSNISPLRLDIQAYYDENIDSWYSYWYNNTRLAQDDPLSNLLGAAGYDVSASFTAYLSQLAEQIAILKDESGASEVSRVFSYVDFDGNSRFLQNGQSYDDDTLSIELFNRYFALYSSNSDRRYRIKSEVKGLDYASGIASIQSYMASPSNFSPKFVFTDEEIVKFGNIYNFLNPIPVSSAQEFLSMEEGQDYRLVQDIVLSDYSMIDCNVSSFDGNGYVIYIDSFNYDEMQTGAVTAGLFGTISEGSMVSNVTVYYTSGVTISSTTPAVITPSGNGTMQLKLYNLDTFEFGGLACYNYGTVTGCTVKGRVSISLNVNATTEYPRVPSSAITAGLVTNNFADITCSRVIDFSLSNYGETGGFVAVNSGKIVSSFVDNCSFSNLSSGNVGGFCYSNSGDIIECFSQGKRSSEDRTIQNTSSGISSDGGEVGGFIYSNSGNISDCYSNIQFTSSRISAGFVYQENSGSVISRCYSISYKNPDDNRTTAFPFAGPTTSDFRVEVKGTLNNCFFISSNEYRDINFYTTGSNDASLTPKDKKAQPLSLDDFATHTNFTSFDLSLDYNTGSLSEAEGGASYNYVDGYTWVIMEGKPVIASTLVPTISLQKYQDKVKTYKEDIATFYAASEGETSTTSRISATVTETTYMNSYGEVVYVVTDNSVTKIKKYTFSLDGYEDITITYSYSSGSDVLIACTYAKDSILDYEEYDIIDGERVIRSSDKNFRASDTVEIVYKDGAISEIVYKMLDNVQYSYAVTTGTRTNPSLIFDYDSFCYYLGGKAGSGQFYRFICDIDLNRNFTPTSYSTLSGVVQGNHMTIDNVYLSYTSTVDNQQDRNTRSFGLFANISTSGLNDTIISNLTFNVSHVVSHSHDFVGVLAGQIMPESNNAKIFLSNLRFASMSDATGVFGVHSVGALSGYVSGGVVIKDISSDVSTTAYYEQPNTHTSTMLYNATPNIDGYVDVSHLSIAGGIVGIFDATQVISSSTFRNYNASNISVYARGIISGIIAGSAFGVIGEDTTVNFVNVTISGGNRSYIASTGYAGGLAGENRGKILASSVTYENEESANIQPHTSMYTRNNYFYNLSTASCIAIGGLVGYNNGGLISNSITTLNVRNAYSSIAGGAVGRMSAGKLECLVASGSILAKRFIGGLVGVICSRDDMIYNGYSTDSVFDILPDIDRGASSASVIIDSCIAENNYLASDYNYYMRGFNGNSNFNLSSFVALIVKKSTNPDYYAFAGNSFCVDGIVSSASSSNIARYLKPAQFTTEYDSVSGTGVSRDILEGSDGEQAVFPVDIYSMYYGNADTGVSYVINDRENPSSYADDHFSYILYALTKFGNTSSKIYAKNLNHFDKFYKQITSTDLGGDSSYESHVGRYGEIFARCLGDYVKITSRDMFDSWGIVYTTDDGENYFQENSSTLDSSKQYYYTEDGENYRLFDSIDEAYSYRASHEKTFYYLAYPKLDAIEVYRKYTASTSSSTNDDIYLALTRLDDTAPDNAFIIDSFSGIEITDEWFKQGALSSRVYVKKEGITYALKGKDYYYIDYSSTLQNFDLSKYSLQDVFDSCINLDQSIIEAIRESFDFDIESIMDYFSIYYSPDADSIQSLCTIEGIGDSTTPDSGYYLIESSVRDYANYFVTSVASMRYVDINNIRIPLTSITDSAGPNYALTDAIKVLIDTDEGTLTFYREDNETIFTSFDGGKVYSVRMGYTDSIVSSSKHMFTITEIECQYTYSLFDDSTVRLNSSTIRNNTTYSLHISLKEIIYRPFDNGYWSFDSEFFTASTLSTAKYPTNQEIAETYLWTSFIGDRLSDGHIYEIKDAGDLAALAVSVNRGDNYAGSIINLRSDLDLSGKYWVPIGSEDNPFRGTFRGNGHTIKYISVNEKSLQTSLGSMSSTSLPEYAGLFGVTEDAIIENVSLTGGQVYGMVSGGVVGYAKNTTFINVSNNNTSIGVCASGGVVGRMERGGLCNVSNSGSVLLDTLNMTSSTGTSDVYVGGIAGYATLVTMEKAVNDLSAKLYNSGKISVKDNKTSYYTGLYVTVYCGGLFGKAENNDISYADLMSENGHIYNNGKINIQTNAYRLFVGGAFGEISTYRIKDYFSNNRVNTLAHISNSSSSVITIDYNNSNTIDNLATTSFVGGVAGVCSMPLYRCNNEADITIDVTNYTKNSIVVGGIAGEVCPYSTDTALFDSLFSGDDTQHDYYVKECFNFSNITLDAMASYTTFIAGGIVGGANLLSFDNDTTHVRIEVLDCYNIGSIHSSNICTAYLAGIVGTNYDRKQSSMLYTMQSLGSPLLTIKRCMNLSSVYIVQYVQSRHIIASITAVNSTNKHNVYFGEIDEATDEVILSCYNFYLRGSSYGGLNTFNSIGEVGADKPSFATERVSDALKSVDTFTDREHKEDDWDFDNIWEQKYSSWYPTLRGNLTSILWQSREQSMVVENNVYLISSADQLSSLASQINDGHINTLNVKFRLTESIDLSNRYWTPIGTSSNPFRGSFDGAGYSIKNMTVNGRMIENNTCGGLFGYIEGASISNIGIENAIIENVEYAGGVACFADNSRLENVYTDFSLSQSSGEPAKDIGILAIRGAGGLVYELKNSLGSTLGLVSSYNNIPVSVTATSSGSNYVGGLVGVLSSSSITNCYNNYYGTPRVYSITGGTPAKGHHALVVGNITGDSSFDNLFSLARSIKVGDTEWASVPTLYEHVSTSPYIGRSTLLPYYDNLSTSAAGVFTRGYSLNVNKGYNEGAYRAIDFPSIRGLGKEWKNALAENIGGIVADNWDTALNTLLSMSDNSAVALASRQYSTSTLDSYKVYTISTARDLALLAKMVNTGMNTSGNEYILMNDIDLSSMYWTPIGISEEYAFRGTFNFNGHVISNMTIDRQELLYAGLFGYTYKATIVNGYLHNSYIRVVNSSLVGATYVGSLVGYAYNTSIYNISSSVRIMAHSTSTVYVGGLAGAVNGSTSYTLRNIRVSGYTEGVDVTGYEEYIQQLPDKDAIITSSRIHILGVSRNNNVFAGGILGYMCGVSPSRPCLLEYATSTANLASICLNNGVYAGGIVGYVTSFASINACSNKGQVKTYSNQMDTLGGVAGYVFSSSITNCTLSKEAYIEGRLQMSSTGTTYLSIVGGIVGVMSAGTVSYCATMGRTYSKYATSDNVVLGAIMGYAMDHDFSSDLVSVFDKNNTGFTIAVDLYREEDETIDNIFFDSLDLIANPNEVMIRLNQEFDENYWNKTSKTLMSEVVYIVGCATKSFSVISPTDHGSLLESGLLVPVDRLGSIILQTEEENAISIAYYVSSDMTLTSKQTTSITAGQNYSLTSLIDFTSQDRIVMTYLTITSAGE